MLFNKRILNIIVRGHSISLGFLCLFIVLAIIQRFLLQRENCLRDSIYKVLQEDGGEGNEHENEAQQESLTTETRLGDESYDFRYRL